MRSTRTLFAAGLILGFLATGQAYAATLQGSHTDSDWDSATSDKDFGTLPQRTIRPSQPTKGLIQHTWAS